MDWQEEWRTEREGQVFKHEYCGVAIGGYPYYDASFLSKRE
jgi:hypothetical protein